MSRKDRYVTKPGARRRVAIVIASPAVATTTGWPVGFRRSFAVRDRNHVTGQRNSPGAETARRVIEAPGR